MRDKRGKMSDRAQTCEELKARLDSLKSPHTFMLTATWPGAALTPDQVAFLARNPHGSIIQE